MAEYKCALCNFNTRKRKSSFQERRVLRGIEYEWERQYLTSLSKHVTENSVLCGSCRVKLYRKKQSFLSNSDHSMLMQSSSGPSPSSPIIRNETVDPLDFSGDSENVNPQSEIKQDPVVPIMAEVTPKSNARCVICHASVVSGRCIIIPMEARLDFLVRFRVLTSTTNRICTSHLEERRLKPSVTYSSTADQVTDLSCHQASALIEEFLIYSASHDAAFKLDFLSPKFRDSDCITWTGWTRDQFSDMVQYLKDTKSTSTRNKYSGLLVFWVKLKTSLSFAQIGSLIINNTDNGRRAAARVFRVVAADLNKHFVPRFLGACHITREDAFSDHMTAYSSVLFQGSLCLIWDGTYYYTEKSNDYTLGRRTYSAHKHRPLVKFMSVVLPDGYVLDSVGPYFADGKNNDSGITQHILSLHEDLTSWMSEGDVCVLDRGFRDVIDVFENLGLEPKMPAFLRAGMPQHSAEEANESRLVTKIRWAVEAYHGRVKKWKLFDQVICHDFLDIIGPLNHVVTAAMNAFRPPLISTNQEDLHLAEEMLRKAQNSNNDLKLKVERGTLSSRGRWTSMDAKDAVPDFPQMSIKQLQEITFGTYQLKQAKSYTREHTNEDGEYSIDIHLQAPGLLRSRIQSRHCNAKRYFCWVEYTQTEINGWYCQCKAGERTVGCCAHIASLLWCLCHVRHRDTGRILGTKKELQIMNAADR